MVIIVVASAVVESVPVMLDMSMAAAISSSPCRPKRAIVRSKKDRCGSGEGCIWYWLLSWDRGCCEF